MGEQLRASVYKYLVAAGEKKAAKALRKAHADEDLENIDSPVLEDLFKCAARLTALSIPDSLAHTLPRTASSTARLHPRPTLITMMRKCRRRTRRSARRSRKPRRPR